MATLVKGVTEVKRFSELFLGELFSLSHQQPGPFVKVGRKSFGVMIPEPLKDSQLFVSTPTMTGRQRFSLVPSVPINEATIVYDAYSPAPLSLYTYSIPTTSGFEGNDPILGPPFAPVDYQLFVTPLGSTQFPNTNQNSVSAHLFWTVPDLTAFAYSHMADVFRSFYPSYSFWFSDSSDPFTAQRDNSGWIGPANYIWATGPSGTHPTQPGFAVPGGRSFTGVISPFGDVDPGTFTHFDTWASRPVTALAYFDLYRSRGDSNFGDPTNTHMPASVSVGTTTTAGFVVPPVSGTVAISVSDSSKVTNGQTVMIITAGLYQVTAIANGTHITVQNLGTYSIASAGSTIASGVRVAGIQTADDPADRDANTNYFYRVRGYTTGALIFPFNNVGLVAPRTLKVTAGTFPGGNQPYTGTVLSWTPPDPTNWPTN